MSHTRPRILLVNPNANADTTAAMVSIAQEAAGEAATVIGMTAPSGPLLITTEDALSAAAHTVAEMASAISQKEPDAVVVSAFGDPGLASLRVALSVPVIGIGEAALLSVPAGDRVAVATTTPGLAGSIDAMGRRYRGDAFVGVFLTPGEPDALMADPAMLLTALQRACEAAAAAGADAIVIGGGPLAVAARSLRALLPQRLVEPIPEAVRRALSLIR